MLINRIHLHEKAQVGTEEIRRHMAQVWAVALLTVMSKVIPIIELLQCLQTSPMGKHHTDKHCQYHPTLTLTVYTNLPAIFISPPALEDWTSLWPRDQWAHQGSGSNSEVYRTFSKPGTPTHWTVHRSARPHLLGLRFLASVGNLKSKVNQSAEGSTASQNFFAYNVMQTPVNYEFLCTFLHEVLQTLSLKTN